VSLYAVSVDPPEVSKRLKQKLGASFTFLSDADGVLLDALNIRHENANAEGGDIAYPTAVLVDGQGIVRWTFQSDTYRQRARPEEIFAALETL
jgi:peroxiredoxin